MAYKWHTNGTPKYLRYLGLADDIALTTSNRNQTHRRPNMMAETYKNVELEKNIQKLKHSG